MCHFSYVMVTYVQNQDYKNINSLKDKVVVPVRILDIGQIDKFEITK